MPLSAQQKDFSYLDDIITGKPSFGKKKKKDVIPDNEIKTKPFQQEVTQTAPPSATKNFDYLDDILKGGASKELAVTQSDFAKLPVTNDEFKAQADNDISSFKYLGKSLGAGFSMGIFENELETDSTPLKVAGVVLNGIGTIASGLLLPEVALFGKGLQAIKGASFLTKAAKIAAPAFKGGAEAAKQLGKELTGQAFKKTAMVASNAATTGAVYGGAVEGIKSIRSGENQEDTFANILTGATYGAAGGLVIGAGLQGVSKLIGNKIEGKATQAIQQFVANKGNVDLTEEITASINKDAKAYISTNAAKFAKKINEENPIITPWEMVARPELLKSATQDRLKPIVDNLFLKEGGPANIIYKTNEGIKKLVDEGNYAAAITSYSASIRSQIKGNTLLKDYFSEPWMMDKEVLPSIMADALISGKKKYRGIEGADRMKLVNYFSDPTSEQFNKELMLIQKTGDAKARKLLFGYSSSKKDLAKTIDGNIRLGPIQLDNMLSQGLTKVYKTLSDGVIDANNASILKDYDSIVNSMITFNKPLTRSVLQSFVKGQTFYDVIGNVKQEDMPVVQKLIDRRIEQENINHLYKTRQGMLTKFKSATGDVKSEIKKDLDKNLQRMYRSQSAINEINAGINKESINPESLASLTKTADSVFIPSIESVTSKIPEAIKKELNYDPDVPISKQSIKNRFFNRDNPTFVKEMTDVADVLQAMDHAGYDVDLTGSGISNLFSNVQRKFRKEFGLNSPFQKIFDAINHTEINKKNYQAGISKELKGLGVKPGSRVDYILPDFIEGNLAETDPAYLSLSSGEREILNKATSWWKTKASQIKDGDVNPVLRRNNETLIAERANYFPFKADPIYELKEALVLKFKGGSDPLHYKGISPDVAKSTQQRPFAGFERQRTGLSEAVGTKRLGFIESVEAYGREASNIIFGTDLAKAINGMAEVAPAGLGKTLRQINERYVLGLSDKQSKTIQGKILNEIRRRVSSSVLLGTPSVALQQVLSIPSSAAFGGKEALSAIWKRFTPDGKKALAESVNLRLRDPQGEAYDLGRGMLRPLIRRLGGRPGNVMVNAYNTYEDFASSMLKVFDREAAGHAFLTGYQKGLKSGLTRAEALRYGDYAADLFQGSMTKIGQPEFMNSVYGRTFSQFMSFPMNMYATLRDDLPVIARSDGMQKALQMLARTYASMSLTNEVLRDNGMPPQFDMGGFFPYHDGNRGMLPGAPGVVANFVNTLSQGAKGKFKKTKEGKESLANWTGLKGTDFESAKAIKKSERDILNLIGVPGTGAVLKGLGASKSKDWSKKTFGEKTKAVIFGKRVEDAKSSKERQKAFKQKPLNKKIKKFLYD